MVEVVVVEIERVPSLMIENFVFVSQEYCAEIPLYDRHGAWPTLKMSKTSTILRWEE